MQPLLQEETSYQIVAEGLEEGRAASFLPPPKMNSRIEQYLAEKYNSKLYRHQALAIEKILAGGNVVLSTPTASGKSLAFHLPVMESLLTDFNATSIFLYPQKALSGDQERKLKELVASFRLPPNFVGRYDGSVSGEEKRKAIIKDAKILLATPDVLHTTILRLSGEEEYRSFFGRLRYVVLDECHLYDGVFGTNMAFLMRRLRQVASWEGANPQFIAASATIRNPESHLERLTGLPFTNLGREADGSGNSGRAYRLLKPLAGKTMYDVVAECVAEAIAAGEKCLVFLDSRQGVESLNHYLLLALGEEAKYCAPYRSGYTPEERMEIEGKLASGKIRCVLTTSALEVGIDLPDLDRCILCGVPEARTSFFQRVGRVGRGLTQNRGKVDIVFGDKTVDEYYFRHPQLLWDGSLSPCYLNLNNQRLLADHSACLNYEQKQAPQRELDPKILGEQFIAQVKQKPNSRSFALCHSSIQSSIPHFGLNLRALNDPVSKIIVGRETANPLGTINLSQILREAYKGAIYKHNGQRYRVVKTGSGVVRVKRFFGESTKVTPIRSITAKRRSNAPQKTTAFYSSDLNLEVCSTWFNVTHQVLGYWERTKGKVAEHRYEETSLSSFMVTQGMELKLNGAGGIKPASARALGNALYKAAPLVAGFKLSDLSYYSRFRRDEALILIIDDAEGGMDLAWRLVPQLPVILKEAEGMLTGCSNCAPSQERGCFLCCRLGNEQIEQEAVDRLGGAKLAQRLLKLIEKGAKAESQLLAFDLKLETINNTGFILEPGAKVFVKGICKIGTVQASKGEEQGRLYTIELDGQERLFFDSQLELIEGELSLWCLNCNKEQIPQGAKTCPHCGQGLFGDLLAQGGE